MRAGVPSRLWLITTNENINAIRFYQRRGMDLVAVHHGFVETVRALKPDVRLTGADGVEFEHALEFEYPLDAR